MMGLGPSGQPWEENQRCTAYNISFWKMPSSVFSSGNWDVDKASGGGRLNKSVDFISTSGTSTTLLVAPSLCGESGVIVSSTKS